MFGNSFYFLFLKTCFGNIKKKKFLSFLNQKHVQLVEIKKKQFFKEKKTKICCYQNLNYNAN